MFHQQPALTFELPPQIDDPKIVKAHAQLVRLRSDLAAVRDDVKLAADAVSAAEQQDLHAFAAAHRRAKRDSQVDDPGTPATENAKAQLAALERREEALMLAAGQAYSEVVELVEGLRAGVIAELDGQRDRCRQALLDAIDRAQTARFALVSTHAVRDWLEHFPERPWRAPAVEGLGTVPLPEYGHGAGLSYTAVFDHMRNGVKPKAPAAPVPVAAFGSNPLQPRPTW